MIYNSAGNSHADTVRLRKGVKHVFKRPNLVDENKA